MKNILVALHQRPIAVYPIYIDIMESASGGIVLSQILYWWSKKGGKFWKTDEELRRETRVSAWTLRTIKVKLKELGFIIVTREGIPCKTFYDVDPEAMGEVLEKYGQMITQEAQETQDNSGETQDASCVNFTKQADCGSHNPYTETTTETTTKIKKKYIKKKYPDEFEDFWKVLPKRSGSSKSASFKIWKAKIKTVPPDEITRGAMEFASTHPDPRYTPLATTWLNGERWDAEYVVEPSKRADDILGMIARGQAHENHA